MVLPSPPPLDISSPRIETRTIFFTDIDSFKPMVFEVGDFTSEDVLPCSPFYIGPQEAEGELFILKLIFSESSI